MSRKELNIVYSYLQKWWIDFLVESRIDMVDYTKEGLVLGYPSGGGNSGLIRITPLKDGSIVVAHGEYSDRADKDVYEDTPSKYKSIDEWMESDDCCEKSEKPEKVNLKREDYRGW